MCSANDRWRANSIQYLLLIASSVSISQVSGFWFADSSLFQPLILKNDANLEESSLIKSSAQAVDGQRSINGNLLAGDNSSLIAARTTTSVQSELPKRLAELQKEEKHQLGECQCNSDWLQNQTHLLLARWLQSASTGQQLRSLIAWNSTGGANNINSRTTTTTTSANAKAHQFRPNVGADSSNNNGTNHWSGWIRSKSGSSYNIGPHQHHHGSRIAKSPRAKQQQQEVKPVQGERGIEGPKGDQGARGEKGERGQAADLISVRDRNALFDLAEAGDGGCSSSKGNGNKDASQLAVSSISGDKSNKQPLARRFAFIESEQLLVLETASGWRPIQLEPALRDFRKTIGKFSLNSSADRRRLIASGSSDNSIKRLADPAQSPLRRRPGEADGSRYFNGQEVEQEEEEEEDIEDDEDEDEEEDDDDDEDDDDIDQGAEDERDDLSNVASNGDSLMMDNKLSANSARRSSISLEADKQQQSPMLALARSGAAASSAANFGRSLQIAPPNWRTPKPADSNENSKLARAGQLSAVEPGARMQLRIAALNGPFSGNVHGIRGADFECRRNAARSNIKGSFRAFLASGIQNLPELVRHNNVHKYPVANLRGEILANSWHDLFRQSGRIANPLSRIYSFDGRHVASDSNWPNKLVWHGANNKAGLRDPQNNCDGWHSDSLNKFGSASPLHQSQRIGSGASSNKRRQRKARYLAETNRLANSTAAGEHNSMAALELIDKYPCRMPLVVLCIETVGQLSDPVTIKPANSIVADTELDNQSMNSI